MSFKLFGLSSLFCHYLLMSLDYLKKLTTGFVKGWNRGKLKETLKETAQKAIDSEVENIELKEKVGQLEDQIRKLRGEKPRPKIKPVNSKDLEPNRPKKHRKCSKKASIEVDETVVITPDEKLPIDAKRLSPRKVIVQEIQLERKNICFMLERYYSPAEQRVVEGKVPEGFQGSSFGPKLRSFILYEYYKNRVPHKKIREMLKDFGLDVSSGSINNILNTKNRDFEVDLVSAQKAALTRDNSAHLDETGAKYKGLNYYTFGLSNAYFTRFETKHRKNKKVVESFLAQAKELKFLVTDDAPNLRGFVKNHQLCWVHEIRKYKLSEVYKKIEFRTLNKLLKRWAKFYHLMKRFKRHPREDLRKRIRQEFNAIVSTKTRVRPIDEQLARTLKNKDKLLLFLRYPKLPLENNLIERDLRERVIKRKISHQNRSVAGREAWDLMLSLASTCRKLNISYWDYLQDRISKSENLPYLGRIVRSI